MSQLHCVASKSGEVNKSGSKCFFGFSFPSNVTLIGGDH